MTHQHLLLQTCQKVTQNALLTTSLTFARFRIDHIKKKIHQSLLTRKNSRINRIFHNLATQKLLFFLQWI